MTDRPSSFKRMDMLGMSAGVWMRVLARTPKPVDRRYLVRFLSALSVSSASSAGKRWQRIRPLPPPLPPGQQPVVFVIGHWRSGTTLMQNLLSCDPRFSALTTSQAVFPNLQDTPLMQPVLEMLGIAGSYKRLMDNVIIGPDAPMELEYAIMNLTGRSEYLAFTFPRSRREFLRYLRADQAAMTERETREFRAAVLEVNGRLADGRTVLHKNPPTTANIAEIKRILPRAQFVFLSRNPHEVYVSTLKTWRVLTEIGTLQDDGGDELPDYILERYRVMHEAYLAQRDSIPSTDLIEVAFTDLESDPMGAVERVYDHLGWEAPDPAYFEEKIAAMKSHVKNEHPPLDPTTVRRIDEAWGSIIAALFP